MGEKALGMWLGNPWLKNTHFQILDLQSFTANLSLAVSDAVTGGTLTPETSLPRN